ncbi:MAG: hypothetical protein ASARMPREDX12_005791 [Alectoria sarmentosa]|nr:MAG: hypothetical protein ASARMPREDX12_005791 [Alectoria sarmentosa]
MHVAGILRTGLDLWHEKVKQTSTTSTEVFAHFESNHAQQEILLGIADLSFLYHHYTVIIHRGAPHNQSKYLESARQALSLLQEISPDTESIYNGISWQLIHLPFTSLFMIFGNIMSRPDSAESYNDLKCLNENIEYYRNTGGQYDTFKPEKLVVSLVKIAEEAIQKACRKLPKPGNLNGVSTFGATADIPSPVLPADYDRGLTNIAYSQSSPFPAAPHVNTMDDTEQTDMVWKVGPPQSAQGSHEVQCNFGTTMKDDFMNQAGDQAKEYPLNMDFDLLSWDGQ